MAQYSSTVYNKQLVGKSPQPSTPGLYEALYCSRAQVAVDTSLAAADILNFMYLPDGAIVEDLELISDDIDSNGTPTVTISLGDAGSTTRYLNASTIPQTGGRVKALQTSLGFQVSGKTLVFGTIANVAATKVAGNITVIVYYKMKGKSTS